MKAYTFTMNGHVYFSPTRYEARNFLKTWGEQDPELEEVIKICQALDCSLDDMLFKEPQLVFETIDTPNN
jgi:hypothetical protein